MFINAKQFDKAIKCYNEMKLQWNPDMHKTKQQRMLDSMFL